jgi:preprotein translocase subunit SecE
LGVRIPSGLPFHIKLQRLGIVRAMESMMEKVKEFFQKSVEFFREVKIELLKVTFPTRQETLGSTLVVLVLTTLVGIYLGFSDWALARIMKALLQV